MWSLNTLRAAMFLAPPPAPPLHRKSITQQKVNQNWNKITMLNVSLRSHYLTLLCCDRDDTSD